MNKTDTYTAEPIPDKSCKKGSGQGCFQNFELYNITYSNDCVDGEPFPTANEAKGDGFINLKGKLTGLQLTVHFNFVAVDEDGVLNEFVLSNVHTHNYWLPQNTSHKQPPTSGQGFGTAYATTFLKTPIGACASPNPQQGIDFQGSLAAMTITA